MNKSEERTDTTSSTALQQNDASTRFHELGPNQILNILEAVGQQPNGQILALNSYENRVYRIGLEQGDPIVVKFYRPSRWPDAAIREEHAFTRELAGQEIPVVAPLQDSAGETLHHHAPYRFSLYPCVGGRAPELDNAEQLRQMGTFIARLHAVGEAGSFKHRPELTMDRYLIEPGEYLIQEKLIPLELELSFRTLLDDLIIRVQRCYDRCGSYRTIRLHGDSHQGNILWRDDAPFILDFDDASSGPAVQDIWMFLSGDREYMTARLNDFLNGYRLFRAFNPAELNLIEALRCMRMLHHAAWLAKRWHDPAFPRAFPYFNAARYWEELILNLREQSALMDEPPLQINDSW